ncbi:hypothetical protein [Xenorhabdus aichiensis]
MNNRIKVTKRMAYGYRDLASQCWPDGLLFFVFYV